ncbi:hypothetical protein RHSIM_Rhsim06G0097300 [Rhododendron simsii]|uniref:FHA domain-containing protein n=1 Tax=Rhododendron simsii TaxID=118357 RepID=A0A834GSS2_RHOSS|nr:hypothetical protein RHSIM_Rhsim06G0097300 [Rhododendron simsii]
MADKKEEKAIPVFTVLKNNAILKNIFLLDTPPPFPQHEPIEDGGDPPSPIQEIENAPSPIQEIEKETLLLVGRHPDCNITLEHPSISRFHLRIHSNPSSHHLSLTDLSSVHGTWVSGKKIEAGVRVEMNEGDTMQLGGSSRVYKLHWVPLSRAYDMENPFPLDVSGPVEEGGGGGTDQDENCLILENNAIQSLNDFEGMDLGFSDDLSKLLLNNVMVLSAPPPLQGYMDSPSYEEIGNKSDSKTDHEHEEISSLWSGDNQSPEPSVTTEMISEVKNSTASRGFDQNFNLLETMESLFPHEYLENQCPLREDHQISEVLDIVENQDPSVNYYEQREILEFNNEKRSHHTPFSSGGSQKQNPDSPLMNSEQKSNLPSIWLRRGKPSSVLQIQTGQSRGKSKGADRNADVELPCQLDIEDKEISKAIFSSSDGDDEVFTPDKENFTPNTLILRSMKNMGLLMSNKSSSLKSKVISKGLSTGLDENEEPFTPDKENLTPNTLLLRSMMKKSKMGEIKQAQPLEEGNRAPSVKKNQTPKVLKEQKSLKCYSRNQEILKPEVMPMKSRVERVPFQPLLENSCGKSKSEAAFLSAAMENSNSANYVQTVEKKKSIAMEKKRWNMVVDTNCFLHKESRKALQLLQGLKGTQLIIPRIVIRELDCLNRRGSLFRRKTEAASALQWIEECMVNTSWWIHVQSSEEEGRPIEPTPPASPMSQFTEGNCGFPGGAASQIPFSPWGSLLEIVSPTAEDHILEYALLSRRTMNHGQLVLLTNDVTLKIKSMAEGLICETVEEFRESLVNPFSERFLWTDSSPRGPTWSCEDDVILREKYCSGPTKNPSKSVDGAKGLKLILLHNSRYAQTLVS